VNENKINKKSQATPNATRLETYENHVVFRCGSTYENVRFAKS
jgi:hypothetical protein